MLGTILFVDEATGTGVIRADDGKRYRFPVTDWPVGEPPAAGVRVDFDTDEDRAVGPLPITDAVVDAVSKEPVTAPPLPAAAAEPVAEVAKARETQIVAEVAPAEITLPEQTSADPAAMAPDHVADTSPAAPAIAAMDVTDEPLPGRPLTVADNEMPDYIGLSGSEQKSGGMSGVFVIGGAVLLLVLAALAYMMWDNAESAGPAELASEGSGETVSLFAQEDLPVRNVASMTNATVLGRIARGDRVSGVETQGSADPQSRWLRLDGGNRFVPMTGLGPSAPAALPGAPVVPAPAVPPAPTNNGGVDGTFGTNDGDYRADRNAPVEAVPPNQPAPPIRPAPPPIRPAPPPQRPRPVRPSPPPQREITPSRPQETRPVGPQRPAGPQRQGDPRETQPVG